jgi:hypothetical protein
MSETFETESSVRLFARSSDFQFLGPLARSRNRLTVATIVLWASTAAFGLWASQWVMESSQSVGVNMAILAGQFFGMMFSAILLTCTLGVWFWGDLWRRRVLNGERIATALDDEQTTRAADDHVVGFWGLLVVSGVAVYLSVSIPTDSYMQRYNDWGYFGTMLRTPDYAVQIEALRGVAHPANRDASASPAIRRDVVLALASEDPEVRAWAAWSAERLDLVEARDALLRMLTPDSTPGEYHEAALALGDLNDPLAQVTVLEQLQQGVLDETRQISAFRLVGISAHKPGAEWIAAQLGTMQGDRLMWALWAIGRVGYAQSPLDPMPDSLRLPVLALRSSATPDTECWIAEALKHVTNVSDYGDMQEAFRNTVNRPMCAQVRVNDRAEDDEHPRTTLVIVEEPLAAKYMKAAFNIAAPGINAWIELIRNDIDLSDELRREADHLMQAISMNRSRQPRR